MNGLLTSDKQYVQNAIRVGLDTGFQCKEVLDNMGIDIGEIKSDRESVGDRLYNLVVSSDNETAGKLLLELAGHFRFKELSGHINKLGFSTDTEKIGNRLLAMPKQQPVSQPATVSIDNNLIHIEIRPEIYEHIKQYLNNGDYFHAVEEAYKVVRGKLRDITGQEQAHKAFAESNYEKIFGHTPQTDVEKDFFDGVKFLHIALQKFRNEKAHSLADNLDKNLAIHYLSMASLAYDLISRENK